MKSSLVQLTEELVSSAVRGETAVGLVSAVTAVLPPVTGQPTVHTDSTGCTLELPVGALVVQAVRLVCPVAAVAVPVTPSPATQYTLRDLGLSTANDLRPTHLKKDVNLTLP